MRTFSSKLVTNKRWFFVLVFAVVGAAIAPRAATWYREGIEHVFGGSFEIGANAPTVLGSLLDLLLLYWCISWFKPSLRQFKNCLRYPPALLAVPLGYACFAFIDLAGLHFCVSEQLAIWAPLAISLTFFGFLVWNNKPEPLFPCIAAAETNAVQLDQLSEAQIAAWLDRQEAIGHRSQDLFGATAKAERIARALREARDHAIEKKKRKTIAVVGPFGVGKTSIIHLAEQTLMAEKESRFIFAHASCWGFESAAKAQEKILDTCVTRLAAEIDCNTLRPMPGYYRDAIGESEGMLKPFWVWAIGAYEPKTQLVKFTPFLTALDAHLVIVIEDIDREDPSFDAAQIMAMLHHLREVERVSFILAVGHPAPIELFKIADEVVFIEPLLPEQTLTVVDKVRTPVLTHRGFIDPEAIRRKPESDHRNRNRPKTLSGDQVLTESSIYTMEGGHIHSWPGDLGRLLGPARTLKGALRDFRAKWETLWGEVDPDELLILSALRHATPDIYQFALAHMVDFKHLNDLNERDDKEYQAQAKNLREKLQQRWNRAAEGYSHTRDAATALVAELFPGFALVANYPLGHFSRNKRIQSISGDRGPEYLKRIHSGELAIGTSSDREALALLRQFQQGDATSKARSRDSLLNTKPLQTLFCALDKDVRCVSDEDKLNILSCIFDSIRGEHGRKAEMHAYNTDPFDEWLPKGGGNLSLIGKWFVDEVDRSLPANPDFAASLITYSSRNTMLFSDLPSFAPTLRAVLAKHLQHLSPEAFTAMLEGGEHMYTLTNILLPFLPPDRSPPTGLEWLPPLLLGAMQQRSTSILAQIASIFQGRSNTAGLYFNAEFVAAFFGTNAERFYELLSEAAPERPDPHEFWTKIRAEARQNFQNLRQ